MVHAQLAPREIFHLFLAPPYVLAIDVPTTKGPYHVFSLSEPTM
jgi:hypothetical protein